jgi:hypothetical protein
LGTATRINSSGLIEAVAADAPRFDYTLNTGGSCRGLLVEEARTNLCLQSEDLTTTWQTNLAGSVTANAAISPDGTQNADQIVLTGGAFQYVFQNITVTSGQTYTFSFYVRSATAENTQFRAYGDYIGGTATAVTPTQSWVRRTITFVAGDATATVAFAVPATGAAVSIYIWGAQLEAGAFATSYIPTTTTSLTRNADVVSMTGTNFSSWYNASEGAFLTKFSFPSIPASQFRYVLAANDGTATNFIAIAGNTTSNVPAGRVIASSSTQASMGGGAITANQEAIGVLAYKQDSFAYGQNGATLGTDATGLVPTVNRLDIGALGSSFACAHIQRIAYWPQRIINNETLSFSK